MRAPNSWVRHGLTNFDISFFAIAFANYVELADDFKQSFADWLKVMSQQQSIARTHCSPIHYITAKN